MIAGLIILFIVLMLGALGGFGFLAFRNRAVIARNNKSAPPSTVAEKEAREEQNKKAKRGMNLNIGLALGLFFAILFCLIIGPAGLFTVDANEIAIVKQFGEPVSTHTAGIVWRNAFTQSVERYDLRQQRLDLSIDAQTQDAQPFTGTATIYVQIRADDVVNILQRFGTLDNLLDNFRPAAIDSVKAALVDKTAIQLIEGRAALPAMMKDKVELLEDRFYLEVRQAALPELQFSRAFMDEIEARMVAQQAILRAQEEQRRQEIEAQTRLIMAEIEKRIIVVEARADADAMQVMMQLWNGYVWIIETPASGVVGSPDYQPEVGHWEPMFSNTDDILEIRTLMLQQMIIEQWDGSLPEVFIGSEIFEILMNMFSRPEPTP